MSTSISVSETFPVALLNWPVAAYNLMAPGGVLEVGIREVEGLNQRGYPALLFGQDRQGDHPYARELGSYRWAGKYGGYLTNIEFVLRSWHAPVVHGLNHYMVASRFPERALTHYVNSPHDAPLVKYEQRKTAYQRAHYALCSRFVLEQFRELYPAIPESQCFVLYNSVDTKLFTPVEARPSRLDGKKRLLFLAAWVPEKGIDVLIDVVERLHAQRPQQDYYWEIAGGTGFWKIDPAEAQRIDQRVQELGERFEQVHIVGPVARADLPRALAEADIFVVPSLWPEPFALTNLYALACGTPVVATRIGGTPEAVRDGVNGAIVEPGDVEALCQSINRLLDSDALRREMGDQARRTAVQSFTWETHIDHLLEIYRRIRAF